MGEFRGRGGLCLLLALMLNLRQLGHQLGDTGPNVLGLFQRFLVLRDLLLGLITSGLPSHRGGFLIAGGGRMQLCFHLPGLFTLGFDLLAQMLHCILIDQFLAGFGYGRPRVFGGPTDQAWLALDQARGQARGTLIQQGLLRFQEAALPVPEPAGFPVVQNLCFVFGVPQLLAPLHRGHLLGRLFQGLLGLLHAGGCGHLIQVLGLQFFSFLGQRGNHCLGPFGLFLFLAGQLLLSKQLTGQLFALLLGGQGRTDAAKLLAEFIGFGRQGLQGLLRVLDLAFRESLGEVSGTGFKLLPGRGCVLLCIALLPLVGADLGCLRVQVQAFLGGRRGFGIGGVRGFQLPQFGQPPEDPLPFL